MASDQFIVEMHNELNPGADVHEVDDLTGEGIEEVMAIVADKHNIRLISKWIPGHADVDLNVLRNILTSASLSASDGLKKQDEVPIGKFSDGGGNIDLEKIKDYEINAKYYLEQLAAIEILEQLTTALTASTNEPGFYMKGIE